MAGFEKDIHSDDRAAVAAAVKKSLTDRLPYHVTYRLPPNAHGEECWIASSGSVLVAEEESLVLFGICRDVTERMRTEQELRLRAQRQELVAKLGQQALVEEDLQKLLDEITKAVVTMFDVDLVNVLELVPGDTELIFRSGHGWNANVVEAGRIPINSGSQANYALAQSAPVVVTDLRTETRFTPSPLLLEHGATSSLTTTIVGHDNRKYGIFSVHSRRPRVFSEYDVALLSSLANIIAGAIQRRQLDQRQKMMIRELHHRSGNLFSQLLALFSQTASNSRSIGELTAKYEARVLALAKAHRFIAEGGWQPASLLELLGSQLAPCQDRVTLRGPNVYLEPASAFALSTAMHEFVTNAIKHGSLSALSGHVDVKWFVERSERGARLVLDWEERDGPAPKRVQRTGFGSRLINTVIERQMSGDIRRNFQADGLKCRLSVPLTHERWPEMPAGQEVSDNPPQ
jgi:two-component sensor histidine kinase